MSACHCGGSRARHVRWWRRCRRWKKTSRQRDASSTCRASTRRTQNISNCSKVGLVCWAVDEILCGWSSKINCYKSLLACCTAQLVVGVQIGATAVSFHITSRTFTTVWTTTCQVWRRSGPIGSRRSVSWNRVSCSTTFSTARQRSSQM